MGAYTYHSDKSLYLRGLGGMVAITKMTRKPGPPIPDLAVQNRGAAPERIQKRHYWVCHSGEDYRRQLPLVIIFLSIAPGCDISTINMGLVQNPS